MKPPTVTPHTTPDGEEPVKQPPDPEAMNNDRAKWAGAALQHFQCVTGTDYEDALGDLLCDLMHWSDRSNFDLKPR